MNKQQQQLVTNFCQQWAEALRSGSITASDVIEILCLDTADTVAVIDQINSSAAGHIEVNGLSISRKLHAEIIDYVESGANMQCLIDAYRAVPVSVLCYLYDQVSGKLVPDFKAMTDTEIESWFKLMFDSETIKQYDSNIVTVTVK